MFGWGLIWVTLRLVGASLVVQMVQNLPVMQETWVQSLGWEDTRGGGEQLPSYPLQYSCLENSMDRGAWQSMGLQRVGHD